DNDLYYLNLKFGDPSQLTWFNAKNNDLTCIETLDPAWATENWTSVNGNIDEGVEFSVVCVPEGYTYVPDNNFEQALVDLGHDDALDNFVLIENIADLDSLDVSEKEINDLTGIEDFAALTFLNCQTNQLTSLDVSANTALEFLTCDNNQLTNLDVSNNTALTQLYCNENQLTTLDVSNNTALETLDCQQNQLTSLDVSVNAALTSLEVNDNQLTYLNMKNGVTDALTTFNATNNDSLECIEVNEEDVDYATENWTSANGNIDEGASFTVCCMVSEDCLAPQAAFGVSEMYLAVVPGSETQYNISLANSGNLALDYTVSIDATSTVYTWLSTTVDSGQVPGDSTVSIPVTLEQTENLSAGTFTGYLYFGTNTGADLDVIIANTDTVTVTLNLMSDDAPFADTTVTVAAGNSDPIDFTDESGQSTGITVDFEYSDGGSVMVQSIGLPPPMDETPSWVDPDGLITDPAFPNKYFEISTDIAGDYWVDIGLDYTMLPGVDDPQSLRLAKRPGYAGASEPWTVIAVANTEINTINGLVVAKSQTSFSQWAMISNSSDNSFMDTQGPVISNFALAPAQPSILEDVIVTSELTDDTGIETATLYYKAGGGSGYTSVDMSGSGSSYSGTIPGSAVNMKGLFYYIVAQDPLGLSTTSDTLSSPVQFIAGSLSTGTAAGSAYPNGLPMDAWRMISTPAVLDETGVGLVIGDELGPQDDNTWRMFEYDQTTSSYKANPVDFTMGESYWLYQRVEDNLNMSTPAGETGNMSGTSLTITSGWNFIGSPYPFPISLSLDQVQFYGPITYGLSGENWSSVVTELDPWNGYAVYNRTASDKTIVLDPGSAGAGLAARSLAKEEGWLMTLQVSAEEYQDRFNTIGALSSAHDERDWHDNPEITAPGKSVSLSFKIPDEEGTHGVTSDVRDLDGHLKVWDAKIRTQDLEGAVNLS
ncbi:MAG: leucine-rich repeat domain-containing protein, partial [Candidatus Marinimicrobia bacterium]|nr:leucine-rich repeat domain-containing protein [Candidatus Neomarinimicrobiota bacterium]